MKRPILPSFFTLILGPFCIIEHREIDISVIFLKVPMISRYDHLFHPLRKKKGNVSLPNRLARNFSNIIQQPNEGFFEGGVGGVESLVQPRTRHASRDFSFLNEKEIRDSHRLSIIHPRAFTMQTRDGVRGRPDEKLEQARLVPSQRYRRNVVQGGVTTLHHHRRESTVLLLLLPLP